MQKKFKIKFRALLSPPDGVIENGELTVEAGKIVNVSPQQTSGPAADCLDLSDCLLLPGFVNAHCHLSLSALQRQVPKCENFTDWVRELLEKNAALPVEGRIQAIRKGADSMLQSGVTTLADYFPDAGLLDEYAALPFRQVLFLETLGFKKNAVRDTLDRVVSVFEKKNSKGQLLTLGLAPHAPYSVSPDLFRELKKQASQLEVPFSCHVAEFPEEVRFLKEGGGELEAFLKERGVYEDSWQPPGNSPVRYLDEIGVLDSMVCVHLNHIDDDLDLLAARHTRAVFCPGSTRWFDRKRYMPVRELLDRRVTVALGTDSLASNESLNFLRELRIAEEMLPSVRRGEILEMATRGGGKALDLPVGTLTPSRAADLIGFRVDKMPDSWGDVPFEANRESVDFAMVGGKVVFEG